MGMSAEPGINMQGFVMAGMSDSAHCIKGICRWCYSLGTLTGQSMHPDPSLLSSVPLLAPLPKKGRTSCAMFGLSRWSRCRPVGRCGLPGLRIALKQVQTFYLSVIGSSKEAIMVFFVIRADWHVPLAEVSRRFHTRFTQAAPSCSAMKLLVKAISYSVKDLTATCFKIAQLFLLQCGIEHRSYRVMRWHHVCFSLGQRARCCCSRRKRSC